MKQSKGGSVRAKKGDGSIRKTPAGSYEYRIRYTNEMGQRKTKTFTSKTVEGCFDKAEEFQNRLAKLARGVNLDDTIPDIVRAKIENDFMRNYTGEQGFSRNIQTLKVIERHFIGRIPIADITEFQLSVFLNDITKYSDQVISKIYSLVKYAFATAYRGKIIDYNPMDNLAFKKPKSSKKTKKPRGFTQAEQARFVQALEEHKVPFGRNSYKKQLLIELYGGLRMGEVNALKPEDIDFENKVIHVRSTVTRGMDDRVFIKEGAKTAEGERDVPMSATLEKVLIEALEEMEPNPEGLVFYDHRKKGSGIISTGQVNSFFYRICEKASLKGFTQHCLRHTFATRCIEAGVQPIILKKWMGHTNIHITLDTYADVFDKMNNTAIDQLDSLLKTIKLPGDVVQ